MDEDWEACRDTRKSTTGIIISINSARMFGNSKRQHIVSLSSTEAECITMSTSGKKITRLSRLFAENLTLKLLADKPQLPLPSISTENTAAISLVSRDQVSERNKNIELKEHHIIELHRIRAVTFDYLGTTDQLANRMTKPLSSSRMQYLLHHFIIHIPRIQ